MSPTLKLLVLWLAFAVTHSGVTHGPVRSWICARLGERVYQALYSVIALVIFVPLVGTYFANKHAGAELWDLGEGPVLRWIIYIGMGVALVLVVSALVRPSPASVIPGDPTPHGVQRITRHPMMMGFALLGLLHLVGNGFASDLVFFGGITVYSLVGAWHQDQRKLAEGPPGFRAFWEATPFLPFTGRGTLQGLRELSPVALLLGVALTVVLRLFHDRLFG